VYGEESDLVRIGQRGVKGCGIESREDEKTAAVVNRERATHRARDAVDFAGYGNDLTSPHIRQSFVMRLFC